MVEDEGEIESGFLRCVGCGAEYPIEASIPRLLPASILKREKDTASTFEYAWRRYGPHLSHSLNSEFLGRLPGWGGESFHGKLVLDAGCGAGRLARLAQEYGAGEVFAIDLGRSVDVAKSLSRHQNIHFIQASLFQLPFRPRSFDVVFSLGVLHHTKSPAEGFSRLIKQVKPAGKVAIWVYAKEGNEIVAPLLNVFRRLTVPLGHLQRRMLAGILVEFMSVGWNFASKIGASIPYRDYLRYFHEELSFLDREYVAFDFLSTPIVNYISRTELDQWVAENNLQDPVVAMVNSNSWSLTGEAPGKQR